MELAAMQMGHHIAVIAIVVVLLALAGAGASYFLRIYKQMVAFKNECDRQFAGVDALLKERHDELFKLLEISRKHMRNEQETLRGLADARSFYMQATTPEQKAEADSQICRALKTLYAVAENYPDLKAEPDFPILRDHINELERKILDQRDAYNVAANQFNARIAEAPANFVAALVHFQPQQIYAVPESGSEDERSGAA